MDNVQIRCDGHDVGRGSNHHDPTVEMMGGGGSVRSCRDLGGRIWSLGVALEQPRNVLEHQTITINVEKGLIRLESKDVQFCPSRGLLQHDVLLTACERDLAGAQTNNGGWHNRGVNVSTRLWGCSVFPTGSKWSKVVRAL